jgi:hypothetical protein
MGNASHQHRAPRPDQVILSVHLVSTPTQQHERWRLMMFGRPIGPWRSSRREADLDAIFSGNGTYDEQLGCVFITAPAWLHFHDLKTGQQLRI